MKNLLFALFFLPSFGIPAAHAAELKLKTTPAFGLVGTNRYVIVKAGDSVKFSVAPTKAILTLSWTFTNGSPSSATGYGPHTVRYKGSPEGKVNEVKFASSRKDTDGKDCTTPSKVTCRVAVPVPKAVAFSGDHPIKEDNGTVYDAPQWQDNSSPLDSDVKDTGDKNFPVCFTRDTKMKVKPKFEVDLAPPAGVFQIRGKRAGKIQFPATAATLTGTVLETSTDVEATEPLPDNIGLLNPMRIDWEISFNGGTTWGKAGKTDSRVYVTLAAPTAGTVFETVLDIGCRRADGLTSDAPAVAAIWGEFLKVKSGVKRKPMDGHNEKDGKEMGYWTGPASAGCGSVGDMLAEPNGDGSCGAWAQLLNQTLEAQGIAGSHIYEIQANPSVNPGANGFLVKDWKFGKHIRTGADGICNTTQRGDDFQAIPVGMAGTVPNALCISPGPNGTLDTRLKKGLDLDTIEDGQRMGEHYPYILHIGDNEGVPFGDITGDAANQKGIYGQRNPEPPEYFFNHFVLKYAGKIYDPSYGAGPFSSENAHENAAIDGIKFGDLARPNDPALQELYYSSIP